jgi:hypothetical protein
MFLPRFSDVRLIASPVSMRKPYSKSATTGTSQWGKPYRLERSGGVWARRCVVYGQSGIVVVIKLVRYLRDALVCAVAGFEVKVRCPRKVKVW